MNDPQRLLISDGTPLERELLRSVLDEPVPQALHARMAAALLLPSATPLAETGSSSLLDDGAALNSTSQGALTSSTATTTGVVGAHLGKVLLATFAVGSALTASWVIKERSSADVTSPSANVATTPAAIDERADSNKGQNAERVAERVADTPLRQTAPEEQNVNQASDSARAELAPKPIESPALGDMTVDATDERRTPVRATSVRDVKAPSPQTDVRPRSSNAVAAEAERAPTPATLGAELKLLDAARAAIQRGDDQQSLRVLDAYARQFPNGELAHEAKVLRQLTQRSQQP